MREYYVYKESGIYNHYSSVNYKGIQQQHVSCSLVGFLVGGPRLATNGVFSDAKEVLISL